MEVSMTSPIKYTACSLERLSYILLKVGLHVISFNKNVMQSYYQLPALKFLRYFNDNTVQNIFTKMESNICYLLYTQWIPLFDH